MVGAAAVLSSNQRRRRDCGWLRDAAARRGAAGAGRVEVGAAGAGVSRRRPSGLRRAAGGRGGGPAAHVPGWVPYARCQVCGSPRSPSGAGAAVGGITAFAVASGRRVGAREGGTGLGNRTRPSRVFSRRCSPQRGTPSNLCLTVFSASKRIFQQLFSSWSRWDSPDSESEGFNQSAWQVPRG